MCLKIVSLCIILGLVSSQEMENEVAGKSRQSYLPNNNSPPLKQMQQSVAMPVCPCSTGSNSYLLWLIFAINLAQICFISYWSYSKCKPKAVTAETKKEPEQPKANVKSQTEEKNCVDNPACTVEICEAVERSNVYDEVGVKNNQERKYLQPVGPDYVEMKSNIVYSNLKRI
ncbi:uncharacterized protein LOC132200652 [Neocloeon triangulifer]|uniref:uncharacterized protein LOC132200652 n=1 Tax=Neocloeon triangulifer TaxID=2078957 RepID=UPI00286EEE76|nr:uncharacterized protein LOC132200652 [Neocloeon triangulifer]